jgi:hypothetical protein
LRAVNILLTPQEAVTLALALKELLSGNESRRPGMAWFSSYAHVRAWMSRDLSGSLSAAGSTAHRKIGVRSIFLLAAGK